MRPKGLTVGVAATVAVCVGCALVWAPQLARAQRRDAFVASRDDPAIQYTDGPTRDLISALNDRLRDGDERFDFDPVSGYLASTLRALQAPVESQLLVFSPTSFQNARINLHNPRAVYFNDVAAVGWVRGGDNLEVAVQDPKQGVLFYQLRQEPAEVPQFTRNNQCLACHLSWDTYGVPGLFMLSMYPLPDDPNAYANGFTTSHGSPLEQRWGGWYVTGSHGGVAHMGNVPVDLSDHSVSLISDGTQEIDSVRGLFALDGYPTPYSDVVPLLILAHQTHTTNLITRLGWEARLLAAGAGNDQEGRVQDAVQRLVDQLLFIDEAPLEAPVRGGAGYEDVFQAPGPRDGRGRSLRELDLEHWLMRYPCSYMIYSDAFDALPPAARQAVYSRLWAVLSGGVDEDRYTTRLSPSDRQAVIDILRDTKDDLPSVFGS